MYLILFYFFQGLNQIFANQVFIEQHDSHFFNLKRVQVAFGICESDLIDEKYDKNCTEQRNEYLKAFSRIDTTDFCLAYILTYLDFHNGTAGLANIGTVCQKSGNTGFVTMVKFTTCFHEFFEYESTNFKCDELALALLKFFLPSFLPSDRILTNTKILTNKSFPSIFK